SKSCRSFSNNTNKKRRFWEICKQSRRTWRRHRRRTSRRLQISGTPARILRSRWERTESDERHAIGSTKRKTKARNDAECHRSSEKSGRDLVAAGDRLRRMRQRATAIGSLAPDACRRSRRAGVFRRRRPQLFRQHRPLYAVAALF